MPNARLYTDPHYASGGPIEADVEYYDGNLTAGVNGDFGGSYAPSSPIVFSGAGFVLTGPLVMARSAKLHANTAPTVSCNDGDWPVLGPANPFTTHIVMNDVGTARGVPSYHWQARADGGLQAVSPMLDLSDGLGMRVARAQVAFRAHDRSTISQIMISFRVGAPHQSVPSTMPSVRVLRMDASGNVAPLSSVAVGASVDGYITIPRPSSPSAWYTAGGSQSLTIPCDQNNVVDVSTYAYLIELVEEQGLTGYPWALLYKQPVVCAMTAYNSAWFTGTGGLPSAVQGDGLTLGTGDRVLISDQIAGFAGLGPAHGGAVGLSTQTGIWIVNGSAPWTRASDWVVATDFVQGMVVPIVGGTIYGALCGHADPSIKTWAQTNLPGSQGTALQLFPRGSLVLGQAPQPAIAYPQGIIWDCAVATYSNIADLRPQ